MAIMITY